jgi:type III restriction enzyme
LVVEYKSEDRATNDDSKEKANIGEIWAKLSKDKALFLLTTIRKGGKNFEEQIREKIRT